MAADKGMWLGTGVVGSLVGTVTVVGIQGWVGLLDTACLTSF